MLHINDLTHHIAGKPLFEQCTAAIPAGWRVGLVGRNGTGKSTLLRLITGEQSAESGSVNVRPSARIGTVAQEAPSGERSLIDTVLAADTERAGLLAQAETETDPHQIAEIHTRLADIGAHAAPARAAAILAGLGFSETQQQQPCQAFSGGWRMRVALAAVLFSEPDLLLLDEPTNYLDLEGTVWLESYLKSYPYTVLLVSHDRDLLNSAVNHILHLENRKLTLYGGGYDQFEETRRQRLAQQMALKSKQDTQRRHLQQFVDRFRYQASKARQAQSRLKILAQMQPIAAVTENHVTPFEFPAPERLSPPLIALEQGVVGYHPDKPVLRRLDLRVDMDDRIALLGANGNGKSTLAKLLIGKLRLQDGRMRQSKKLRIGYLAQHQIDELNPKETPYDHFRAALPEETTEAQLRARLGGFGFGIDKADTQVADLSGGEKTRLLFALLCLPKPHLMILDEPTNHLDVDSREALAQGLNEYEGAVLLISHDRHLVNACADRLWVVQEGTVTPYEGNLDDYRTELLRAVRQQQKADKPARDKNGTLSHHTKSGQKHRKRNAAEKRAALTPLKQAAQLAEERLSELQSAQEKLQNILTRPNFFRDMPQKAQELAIKGRQLQIQIAAAEDNWLAAQEAYETALAEE